MAAKKKSNKELNEELDELTKKFKIMENLMKELVKGNTNNLIIEEILANIDTLSKKVDGYDVRIQSLEERENFQVVEDVLNCDVCDSVFQSKGQLKKHKKKEHIIRISDKKCSHCDATFVENCELELHLKTHTGAESFECEQCEKSFATKWRLRKHVTGHEGKIFCHYFNNKKNCPFEELGCMFQHAESAICKFQKQCGKKLCQFKHFEAVNICDINSEKEVNSSMNHTCQSCNKICESNSDLERHLKVHNTDGSKLNSEKEVNELNHECQCCNRKFETKSDLESHVRIHESDKKSDNFMKFLKEQESRMKDMTPTELFGLVDAIRNESLTATHQ